jgi:hypothetical protein
MTLLSSNGASGSIVVKALRYELEGRDFETRWGEFLNLPNPSGRGRPGVHSAYNRNEYQNHKNNNVLGSKVRRVHRADILAAICEPIV